MFGRNLNRSQRGIDTVIAVLGLIAVIVIAIVLLVAIVYFVAIIAIFAGVFLAYLYKNPMGLAAGVVVIIFGLVLAFLAAHGGGLAI